PNSRRPSGTKARPCATNSLGGSPPTGLPNRRTESRRAGSNPLTHFKIVDLPAPFAPIRVTTCPRMTRIFTACRAGTAPYDAYKSTISSVAVSVDICVSQVSRQNLLILAYVGRGSSCQKLAVMKHIKTIAGLHDSFHI